MRAFVFSAFLAVFGLPLNASDLVVREVLTEKALSGSDTMVVTVSRLVVMPGGTIPPHTHPGDEHAMVITGGEMTTLGGKVLSFADGTPLFFPAGAVHGGLTNSGSAAVEVVTTHILDSTKPFSSPAE